MGSRNRVAPGGSDAVRRHRQLRARRLGGRCAVAGALLAAVVALAFSSWSTAAATAEGKVPPITLDTQNGPYVLGNPPGRVEVLFFSFPG